MGKKSHLNELVLQDQDIAANDFWALTRAANIRDEITKMDKVNSVLDVGCGTGYVTRQVSDLAEIVKGIDLDEDLIDKAKSASENPQYYDTGNIFDLPYDKKSFDLVIAADVIEHLKDDIRALKELKRILKPQGSVLLSVPNLKFLFGPHDESAGHFRRYNLTEVTTLASNAGLRVATHRYCNFFPLIPYIFYQKILHRDLSGRSRAEIANSSLLSPLIRILLDLELRLPLPTGITLIVRLKK